MLTDSVLRSKVDALWDKLWSGGLANPADVIEQLSYLIFLKRLNEKEEDGIHAAKRKGTKYKPIFPKRELRWDYWTQLPAEKALKHVKEEVFPFMKGLGGEGGAFGEYMANAEFKISKPSLLIEACKSLEEMQLSSRTRMCREIYSNTS